MSSRRFLDVMHPALRLFGVGLLAVVVALLGVIAHGALVSLFEVELLAPLVAAVPLTPNGLAVSLLLLGAIALAVAVLGEENIPLIDGDPGADVGADVGVDEDDD